MLIKLFTSSLPDIAEIEKEINLWLDLEENHNIKISSCETKPHMLHDLYHDGNVCNQWNEYITTILYTPMKDIDDNFKELIRKAIESGKGTDWGWSGEDEVPFDTYDVDFAVEEVLNVIKKHLS